MLNDLQTNIVRLLIRLSKPKRGVNLTDIDRQLYKYAVLDTMYSWIGKNRKAALQTLQKLADEREVNKVYAFVERNKIKGAGTVLNGDQLSLRLEVRTPAQLLDQDMLKTYLINSGFSAYEVDHIFRECSKTATPAASYKVEDAVNGSA